MIHYRAAGEGPPVVLLHGLFGSLENLGSLARALAETFRVYSLDLPNHGRSAHSMPVSLQDMAAEIECWMDDQGLSSVALVGHSLGGKVAMEIALNRPDTIAKLVVLDIAPAAYNPHHNSVFEGLNAIDLSTLQDRSEADRLLSQYVHELPVRSFLLKNLVRRDDRFHWRMNLASLVQDYPLLIAANRAGRFDRSCLFIKGENSDYIQARHEQDIRSRFPLAHLKVVSGAGHWLHAEKPALVASLVNRFLHD